jgi:cytochrome c oxidase subunit 3
MNARPPSAGAGVLAPPARRRLRTGPPLPPTPPDRGGDGGDGRGGAPVPPGGSPAGAPLLGLVLALAGIATLFSVFLAAWILLRRLEPDAARASALVPPRLLWISTSLLLASSLALERARRSRVHRAARWGRRAARWLLASLGLGLAFLLAQAVLWWHFLSAGIFPSTGAYGATFFALTGLHAAHVVFGIAWLGRASTRALRAGPDPAALRLLAIYWHFMGCLWLALFAALYFVR